MKAQSTLRARHEFADLAVDSERWFSTADDLLFSAECLEPEIEKHRKLMRTRERDDRRLCVYAYAPDPSGVYLMLMAFAIENLCKGLLVVKDTNGVWAAAERDDGGQALKGELKGHEILVLLSKVNFPLGPSDRDLAALLWRNSEWSGRYPIPLRFDHRTLSPLASPDVETLLSWQCEDGLQVVKDFVSRVDSFVGSELERERERIVSLALSQSVQRGHGPTA